MKQVTTIAATCLGLAVLFAQPALAADANSSAASDAQKASARGGGQADSKQICRSVTLDSGSRVSRKVCRTRAGWAEEGVDLKK